MKPVRIRTLKALAKAAENRKAVIVPRSGPFNTHIPAAVILNLQGAVILNLLRLGMYIYQPKKKGD